MTVFHNCDEKNRQVIIQYWSDMELWIIKPIDPDHDFSTLRIVFCPYCGVKLEGSV